MSIIIVCTCGHRLRAKEELAGKRVKCPKCGAILTVPATTSQTSPSLRRRPEPDETDAARVPNRQSGIAQWWAVWKLSRKLKDKNATDRLAAVGALGQMGGQAVVKPLARALRDSASEVQAAAVHALGQTGHDSAVQPLMAILGQRDDVVAALVALGSASLKPLMKAVLSDNSSIRAGAAHALGKMGDPRALPALFEALKNPLSHWVSNSNDDYDRSKVIETDYLVSALYNLGPASADELFHVMESDDNSEFRTIAVEILLGIGDKRLVPLFVKKLSSYEWGSAPYFPPSALQTLGWKPTTTEERIALALGNGDIDAVVSVAGGAAVQTLAMAITRNAINPETKRKAVQALGKTGDPRAANALLAAIKDKELQVAAVWALRELGGDQAKNELLAALSNPEIRCVAAEALGAIGDPRAVVPLLTSLAAFPQGEQERFKISIVKALAAIGDERALAPLTALLQEQNKDVLRHAAAEAIVKIPGAQTVLMTLLAEKDYTLRHIAAGALSRTSLLLKDLGDPSKHTRQSAVQYLGQLGDMKAIEPLKSLLVDVEEYVRRTAAESLRILGWSPTSLEERVRFAFALPDFETLTSVGSAAILILSGEVASPSVELRERAVKALGLTKDPTAVQTLAKACQHAFYRGRECLGIVAALGQIPGPAAEAMLREFAKSLADEDRVRAAAERCLANRVAGENRRGNQS
jgi:HEAT repeat protein